MDRFTAPTRMTYQDLHHMKRDRLHHELIDGEHFVSPSPGVDQQRLLSKLTMRLNAYVARQKLGEILSAPVNVIFSDLDVLTPDLIFVHRDHRSIITPKGVQGVPDLAVEILSPGTRRFDLMLKPERYAFFGLPEYWIVDPEARSITVHLLREERLLQTVSGKDILNTPAFSDIGLAVATIF